MADVEVIVTTYNNPTALHFALLGLNGQSFQSFRICIADDGSAEPTRKVIEAWRGIFGAERLRHVWHPDNGFAKNQILNKAIASSQASYLVFLDGDCIASPHYLERQMALRQARQFVSGSLIRMPLAVNALLNDELVTSQEIFSLGWLRAHGCIDRLGTYLKVAVLPARLSNLLELVSPVKKVWNGCNSAGWRQDILEVNGFDETLTYGSEDVEMGVRMNNAGIRGRHIRYTAPVLHIEHARGYADPAIAARNKRYMKSVRRSGVAWTPDGIVKAAQHQALGIRHEHP
ncbi:MAG: glycosyltransferase [Limnohabitans sp.]|jgi:glycosyltransferase involved in cell wall biosynthesis